MLVFPHLLPILGFALLNGHGVVDRNRFWVIWIGGEEVRAGFFFLWGSGFCFFLFNLYIEIVVIDDASFLQNTSLMWSFFFFLGFSF
jgi:hypothetical protein